MLYKVTMLIRPKYNQRRPLIEQDDEFVSLLEHYDSHTICFEVTQGTIKVEQCVRERVIDQEELRDGLINALRPDVTNLKED
jgi:hypothetical protein